MRVDPLMQLSEEIRSVLEAIAYPSMMALTVIVLVVVALERARRAESRVRPLSWTTTKGAGS